MAIDDMLMTRPRPLFIIPPNNPFMRRVAAPQFTVTRSLTLAMLDSWKRNNPRPSLAIIPTLFTKVGKMKQIKQNKIDDAVNW